MIEYKFKNILDEALKKWGSTSQFLMCVEEMAELTKQIMKNVNRKRDNKDKIIEETADVLVTTLYVAEIVGYDEVMKVIDQKIKKLENKLKGE